VRAWLKLLSYPTAAGWGVALANYGGNYQGWYLGVRASGQIILSVASLPSNSPCMLSSQPLALNRWYYVAATYDGATRLATIYIDGVADTPLYLQGFTPAPTTGLDFGRASWFNGYYLDAVIDETRVFSAAQTAADILSDFRSFPAQPPAAAVSEWKLDDTG
jgi:hypothetical protein